jgi:hypothetical protein
MYPVPRRTSSHSGCGITLLYAGHPWVSANCFTTVTLFQYLVVVVRGRYCPKSGKKKNNAGHGSRVHDPVCLLCRRFCLE